MEMRRLNYMIIVLAMLLILFFIGAVFVFSASNHNEWVQIRDDREQEEFLREWNKKWEIQ